jgi:hypothetical protein
MNGERYALGVSETVVENIGSGWDDFIVNSWPQAS